MSLATMIALVFQQEIILLFFSEQYLEAGPLLVLSMLATTVAMICYLMGTSTVAAGNSKAPALSNIVNTCFTVVGNLILVPLIGVAGAILSGLIGNVGTNPLNVWFLRRAGLTPKVLDYVQPVFLCVIFCGIYMWSQPELWFVRLLFLLIFVVIGFLICPRTFNDTRTVWNYLGGTLGRHLHQVE